MAASERVFCALVLQAWCASYSMDNNDPWCYHQLLFELYAPRTGLLVVGGRCGGRIAVNALGRRVGPGALLALVRVSSHVEV